MSKIRIFALGGLDEDGKNMYAMLIQMIFWKKIIWKFYINRQKNIMQI